MYEGKKRDGALDYAILPRQQLLSVRLARNSPAPTVTATSGAAVTVAAPRAASCGGLAIAIWPAVNDGSCYGSCDGDQQTTNPAHHKFQHLQHQQERADRSLL